ncbi:MAG: carbohydrate ABC transporter permease [Ardenticatenia bacterium]|nr:MAG: carbohydrate ABC transporter permease [Ardenticatenia bacterium]
MKHPTRLWLHIVLALAAAAWLLPMYVMLSTSLKTPREVALGQYITPPHTPEVNNYIIAFGVLKQGLLNSVTVAIPATALAVFLGSWAGFFLAMFRFRYSQTVFFVASVATFLPYQIILIPFTQFMATLNLFNTQLGLIVAYLLLNVPMAALISSTFFQMLPPELQEAAALDGCGPITFYFRILLPVAQLGLVSTTILIFTMIWNEFLIAITLTQGPYTQMATPVLAGLKGNYAQLWHIQMAGAMITSIPPLIIFIFLGRYFIAGLMAGTLKG